MRSRRDEWIDAGIFDKLRDEAIAAFDRIVGLDLDNVAIDGSLHKAPYGGEATGPNPTDRGKCGWKWSVAADGHGLPIGWAIAGANRNDLRLLHPTLDAVEATGPHHDIGTLHLDRGYDYPKTRTELAARDLTDLDIQKRGTKPPPGTPPTSSPSGCAGLSKPPTPGGPTTGSYADPRTVAADTDPPRSASPPSCSSSADSSTGATAGTPNEHLSAQVLRAEIPTGDLCPIPSFDLRRSS